MGWFLAAASLGYGVLLLLSGILMPHAGWQGSFIATACGPLVAMLISLWTVRATPEAHKMAGGKREPSSGSALKPLEPLPSPPVSTHYGVIKSPVPKIILTITILYHTL